MIDKATISDLLAFVAKEILYILIMALSVAIVVLAADIVALWRLNLLTDIGIWVTLLFFEAFIMLVVSAAGWGLSEHAFYTVGWKRARTYHISLRPRHPRFWISVGMAGVLLIFLAYLSLQYY